MRSKMNAESFLNFGRNIASPQQTSNTHTHAHTVDPPPAIHSMPAEPHVQVAKYSRWRPK